MGLLDKFLGTQGRKSHQAVLVVLPLGDDGSGNPAERDAVHSLADRLKASIEAADAGELDGDEFGSGACTLYMYGADAERLFAVIEPVLIRSPLTEGARITLRFGAPPDAPERTFLLGTE